jgi:hypothetical protein
MRSYVCLLRESYDMDSIPPPRLSQSFSCLRTPTYGLVCCNSLESKDMKSCDGPERSEPGGEGVLVFGQVQRTCWWVIGLPGGSSPRPPFSRFARRAVVGCPKPPNKSTTQSDGGSPRKHDDLLTGPGRAKRWSRKAIGCHC